MRKYTLIKTLFSALFLFVFSACSTEVDLAKTYVNAVKKPSILITSPDFIYKSNLKSNSIKDFNKLSEFEQDSALYYSSEFLQWVDDSVVFSSFFTALQKELKLSGYNVYSKDKIDTFLTLREAALIFDIAQIELEEFIKKFNEEEVYDDSLYYYKEFSLNAVNMNTWFELSQINTESNNRVILYASHYVFDYLDGRFARHAISGDVKYKYTREPMVLKDIYSLSSLLGKKYATYLNDFLMNRYITNQLPQSDYVEKYYHFDREGRKIRPAYDDKFIILEDGE